MKFSALPFTPLVAAALLLCLSCVALGQEDPAIAPAPMGTTVAVVDVSAIFKGSNAFTQAMDDMKDQVQTFDQDMQQKRQDLQTKQQLLATFQPGTQEYQSLQREIAQLSADMQAQITLKGEEFRTREAAIYYETYQKVVATIDEIAQRQGIQLVLRFNGEATDPNDAQSVLRLVNQQIVLQRDIDITQQVLEILNQPGDTPLAADTH